MVSKPAFLLEYIRKHFPVAPQDILITGTPAGVGPITSGDLLQARLREGDRILLACHWDVI